MAVISTQRNAHGNSVSSSSDANVYSVTDEPNSKRLRVAPHKDAEIVDNDNVGSSGNVASVHGTACKASKSTLTLSVGMRVRLQGFDARPHLNGQAGRLRGFHTAHARWLVALDTGSEKFILSVNLEPEASLPNSMAIVADSSSTGMSTIMTANSDEKTVSVSLSTTDTLPIHDCVSAHFQFSRREALRHVEEITAKTCAEVSRLRYDVNQRCSQHQQHFQQYCQMSKPTKSEQQLMRNTVREELQREGRSVMNSMQRLLDASQEPAMALHVLEKDLLGKIDITMDMLAKLRADTVASFIEYEEKLEVDRRANEAAIQALTPSLKSVDGFMQCFSSEVQSEKARADSIYSELLEKLQFQEKDFVDANESQTNPLYAKVKEDLAALNQRLEEQSATDASHMSLMHSWDSMLKSLPSKDEHANPMPAKRTFWRHLKCSNRSVSAST